jgi:hypothetical protein
MNDVKYNPSTILNSLVGENISSNSEKFLLFLKAYYEWLETSTINIINETGEFTVGEEIVGGSSNAKAIVKLVEADYIVVTIKSKAPFLYGETITGLTSGKTATIVSTKDNVVRSSGKLLDNRTVANSVDKYTDYLKDELFPSIPKEYFGNKRLIATKFRELFQSKGNENSYRFLFKILYNEDIEFYYPGKDVLRVSDGKFEKARVFRTEVNSRIFEFLNKTVRGSTNNSLATVVDVQTKFIGGIEIAEMTLKLVSGPFDAEETIVAIDDETLTTTLYGIISSVIIESGGTGYNVGDEVTIIGDGSEARAYVSSIGASSITKLNISRIADFGVGVGFREGIDAIIDNSGTGGSGLRVRVTEIINPYTVTDGSNNYTVGEISRVSIINQGSNYSKFPEVTLEDETIKNIGLLSEKLITINSGGNLYQIGDQVNFVGGSGNGAIGVVASVDEIFANRTINEIEANTISEFSATRLNTPYERNDILFENGGSIIIDGSKLDVLKTEEWQGLGPITRIELLDFGSGYTNDDLPTVTVTSSTGTLADIRVNFVQGTGTNIEFDAIAAQGGLGAIRAVEVANFGINYSNASIDATGTGNGNANLIPIISGLGVKDGSWVNDDGKLNYKYIQDSFFYQDFSYVIRSGLAFSDYADTIKRILHPAGLQAFGEIVITSFIDASLDFRVIQEIEKYVVNIISFLNIGIVSTILEIDDKYKIEIAPENLYANTGLLEDRYVTVSWRNELELSDISTDQEYTAQLNIDVEFSPSLSGNYTRTFPIEFGLEGNLFANEYIRFLPPGYALTTLSTDQEYETELNIVVNPSVTPTTEYTALITTETNVESSLIEEYTRFLPPTYQTANIISTESILNREYNIEINPESSSLSDYTRSIAIETNVEASLSDEYTRFLLPVSEDASVTEISDSFSYQLTKFITVDSQVVSDYVSSIYEILSVAGSVVSTTNKYEKIQGTVSYASGVPYKDVAVSTLESLTLSSVENLTFEDELSLVAGTGTIFKIEFAPNNVFIANNEYFIVKTVLSNTALTIDRPPENVFTNVIAYRGELPFIPPPEIEYVPGTGTVTYEFGGTYDEKLVSDYSATQIQQLQLYPIGGNIRSFGAGTLSDYSSVRLQALQTFDFGDEVPLVSGTNTIFTVEFPAGDEMLANNESFTVKYVFSNTSLIIDRPPNNAFANVIPYKIV